MSIDLEITPSHGVFDIDELRAWLDARPDVFEDPSAQNRFHLCGYPSTAFFSLERRIEDPTWHPNACTANIAAHQIFLEQEYGDDTDLRSALDFLEWLFHRYDCRIKESGYSDLTEKVRLEGVASLYPADIQTAPQPWAGTLIAIGFYRELKHGDSTGPSLEGSIQPEPIPDETALVHYLEAGHVLHRAEAPTIDRLNYDDEIDLGHPHQLTDGVYVWPADLPYYLRTYHVRLPRAFVIHARSNDWHVPPLDIASLPPFEV